MSSSPLASAVSNTASTEGVQARPFALMTTACGLFRVQLKALCRPAGHTFTLENTSLHDYSCGMTVSSTAARWRSWRTLELSLKSEWQLKQRPQTEMWKVRSNLWLAFTQTSVSIYLVWYSHVNYHSTSRWMPTLHNKGKVKTWILRAISVTLCGNTTSWSTESKPKTFICI